MGIFVRYLQQLPEPDEDDKVREKFYEAPKTLYDSKAYAALTRLLTNHFLALYPEWEYAQKTAHRSYDVRSLPDEGSEFERLLFNAATPEHRITKRRREMLQVARDKRRLLIDLKQYEQELADLGLAPDYNLEAMRKPTPL